MIILDATSKSLIAYLGASHTTTEPTFVTAWLDTDGVTDIEGSTVGAFNDTSQVTLCAAPASNHRRIIKSISIYNADTVSATVYLAMLVTATVYQLQQPTTLASGGAMVVGMDLSPSIVPNMFLLKQFANADLTAGVLIATHILAQQYFVPVVIDNNGKQVIPDDVTFTDSSHVSVDLSSYGAITGNWQLLGIAPGGTIGITAGTLTGFLFGTAGVMSALAASDRYWINNFTRVLATANGNVSYTGSGFTPGTVILISAISGNMGFSVGFATVAASGCVLSYQTGVFISNASIGQLRISTNTTDYVTISLVSMDANGFTLSYTKSGSDIGTTANFYALCLR